MTKIYLVTGFLGSGKTTFLNNQLKQTNGRIGVLVNEFGKISIDSIAMKDPDIKLLELSNGSIFCSCLKENFIDGIIELLSMNLDVIYIESSGLADPSNIREIIWVLKKKALNCTFSFMGAICLIDGLYFEEELKKMVVIRRQIIHSNYILINKTDLIAKEKLTKIKELIHQINPIAKVEAIQFAQIPADILDFPFFYIKDEATINTIEAKPIGVMLEFINEPEISQLTYFLKALCSDFYRVKGFINIKEVLHKVDLVNEQIGIVPYESKTMLEQEEELNKLVCLSSNGVSSVSKLAIAANKFIAGLYKIEI